MKGGAKRQTKRLAERSSKPPEKALADPEFKKHEQPGIIARPPSTRLLDGSLTISGLALRL